MLLTWAKPTVALWATRSRKQGQRHSGNKRSIYLLSFSPSGSSGFPHLSRSTKVGGSSEETAKISGMSGSAFVNRHDDGDRGLAIWVNQAWSRLAQMLAVEHGEEFNQDPTIKAALQGTLRD